MVVGDLLTAVFTVLLPPFALFLFSIVALASVGKTLGIRKRYVKFLLNLFEFGKRRLAQKSKISRQDHYSPLSHEEEEKNEVELERCKEIRRDVVFRPPTNKNCSNSVEKHDFKLYDCLDYISTGMEAIVDDEVTKRFTAEELPTWNLLTRTNVHYEFISYRLTAVWVLGFIVRYFILFPLRVLILSIGMGLLIACTYVVGCLPSCALKKILNKHLYMFCFDFLSGALSLVCTYHNQHNVPNQGICVANHTTPIDILVLACDNTYDLVGQRHGGFLGIFQRALSRASAHIWFERRESKDRFAVARRLREHVEDPNKMPILIFPEGTCINNTSVMQFKKGTFEVGGIIYPVAIKYDPRFGDAFWNSSQYSMMNYLYMMMTSWAIVCDVWYLPPMTRNQNESSIDFANRVKAEIARKGGLVDLVWDGGLKRSAPKKEWREQFQQQFSRTLRLRSNNISEKE